MFSSCPSYFLLSSHYWHFQPKNCFLPCWGLGQSWRYVLPWQAHLKPQSYTQCPFGFISLSCPPGQHWGLLHRGRQPNSGTVPANKYVEILLNWLYYGICVHIFPVFQENLDFFPMSSGSDKCDCQRCCCQRCCFYSPFLFFEIALFTKFYSMPLYSPSGLSFLPFKRLTHPFRPESPDMQVRKLAVEVPEFIYLTVSYLIGFILFFLQII